MRGNGSMGKLSNVNFTTISLHVRGWGVPPLQGGGASTTTELRKKGFHLLTAPGLDGTANGSLYLDDGLSIEQPSSSFINVTYNNGSFAMPGEYVSAANVSIEKITICSVSSPPEGVNITGPPESTFALTMQPRWLRLLPQSP